MPFVPSSVLAPLQGKSPRPQAGGASDKEAWAILRPG